jgi:hypothetical protein
MSSNFKWCEWDKFVKKENIIKYLCMKNNVQYRGLVGTERRFVIIDQGAILYLTYEQILKKYATDDLIASKEPLLLGN